MTKPDQRSPEAAAWRRLYNTARWRRIRAEQLAREPLCRACRARGRIVPANVCNHLNKASKATDFFRGPFSSLCAPCHDGGEQKAEIAGYTGAADADGWPTDPNHPANSSQTHQQEKPR